MSDKANRFAQLHRPGAPFVLYNCWDAGSARAIAKAGAQALGTGSWSVAAALGLEDGQRVPLETLVALAAGLVAQSDLPVSIDAEGGYADAPEEVAANIARLAGVGVVGVNFEDRVVGGAGLFAPERQAARIAAIRAAVGPAFFINARTDVFLQAPVADHAALVEDALGRAALYAQAGASGLFVPGLVDPALIGRMAAGQALPVNVMMAPDLPPFAALAGAGVARISHGPASYAAAMKAVTAAARAALQMSLADKPEA
ncbi:isocitrate lyase/phosphoenolpyruvate mutase family protein [Sulfitobacter sp. S190]|uniref:isocitrate lyase/PEP mutase family protein n=1 Tax=Sulfitobacter sp. S190 TaxID=2867022 RepID=UPI0021A65704|nr:isocitrate lyase/phosphoenolpyruvate mutase family protein [Sulfitobacter sp. S190]UWR23533.1 isocitrate lyase/phosphoenolpyruvate mutase family protein [Sulfitobacter sp. S190]